MIDVNHLASIQSEQSQSDLYDGGVNKKVSGQGKRGGGRKEKVGVDLNRCAKKWLKRNIPRIIRPIVNIWFENASKTDKRGEQCDSSPQILLPYPTRSQSGVSFCIPLIHKPIVLFSTRSAHLRLVFRIFSSFSHPSGLTSQRTSSQD